MEKEQHCIFLFVSLKQVSCLKSLSILFVFLMFKTDIIVSCQCHIPQIKVKII